jgi:ketosteroid isomerase-like protein
MPSNLDRVRAIYAASAKGDFGSADWADPDIEYVIFDGPSPGEWRGLAAMASAWRDFLTAWANLRIDAEAYLELDDERVLALTRSSGRGKTSGLEIPRSWTTGAGLWYVHDGKVTRHVVYLERHNALADLGLTPDTGT